MAAARAHLKEREELQSSTPSRREVSQKRGPAPVLIADTGAVAQQPSVDLASQSIGWLAIPSPMECSRALSMIHDAAGYAVKLEGRARAVASTSRKVVGEMQAKAQVARDEARHMTEVADDALRRLKADEVLVEALRRDLALAQERAEIAEQIVRQMYQFLLNGRARPRVR